MPLIPISSFYGDINTNVLVKYEREEDAYGIGISHGDEMDKHSIGAGLNFMVSPTDCVNSTLGYALIAVKDCSNN
ncbi:MAG: hypothetical protein LE180_02510 [Endomicrobium sp.]|uniref:hypothetical protein n=1 Tax=Candidatus Endomicrobiellum pyrsonymphae TaxID=1408203 RepID=UPI003588EF91|nr:hypothetical protein [Endomicrobium sp.]